MKKLNKFLYSIAALLVIAAIAINVYLIRNQQHQKFIRSLSLHQAVIHFPHLIPEILDLGADVNELDADGRTPLFWAVTRGKVDSIELLLKLNADPNIKFSRDNLNPTTLHKATISLNSLKDAKIVKLLLKAGADPNVTNLQKETPLLRISRGGNDTLAFDVSKDLIDAGANVNLSEDLAGMTPLLHAVSSGNAALVDLLLKAGADPNSANFQNATSLLSASFKEDNSLSTSLGKKLIDAGADVNIQSSFNGMTPLHNSVGRGNTQLVDLLLTAGADPEIRNHRGIRAIDQINSTSNPEAIQKIFEKHGADSVRRPELFAKYRKDENSE